MPSKFHMNSKTTNTFSIEEWDESHPRWQEFLACLDITAPEQAPFVNQKANRAYTLIALLQNDIAGFIRFVVQPIGPEVKCPPLSLNGVELIEAKINAFAVRESARGQGIGTELQKQVIRRAKGLGCYQVASYSSYGKTANHHIKLSLGFGAQPEVHGDNHQGVYFIMPLNSCDDY